MEEELLTTDKITAAAVNRVILLVDNTRYFIDLELIVAHPDTMLGRLFSSGMEAAHLNERGEYEILRGISYSIFRAVINYYENGVIICPSTSLQKIKEVCNYLLIPFNATTIRCENLSCLFHELSNDGGRSQFVLLFDDLIRPLMAVSAQIGDRECHVVVLLDKDVVDWDEEYPPKMKEDYIQTQLLLKVGPVLTIKPEHYVFHAIFSVSKTRSTPMYRFLMYIDNRDVARQVMTERGLKKICIGMSGYPTNILKLQRPGEQKEIYYKYVKRPFLHMSWEKEEAKSSLGDFKFIKVT